MPPEWVTLTALETLADFALARGSTCLHKDPRYPEPVYACAWKPGLVTCHPCTTPLFRMTGDADKRCDRCGTVGDSVAVDMGVFGQLTFLFGLCPDCNAEVPIDE